MGVFSFYTKKHTYLTNLLTNDIINVKDVSYETKRGEIMTEREAILSRVCENELFSSLKTKDLLPFYKDGEIYTSKYKSGDVIYSSEKFVSAIGFIVKGSAKVIKKGSDLVVGRLFENDVFGCQSLFLSGQYFTNEIVAVSDTTVLFIAKSVVSNLLSFNSVFSFDYIRYLSKRIYFLNNRIINFTGGTAESRLANYLLSSFGDYKTFVLDISLSSLAVSLDIGRASLYRGFDKLISDGAIERKGKVIRLLDKDVLISFIK